MLFDILLLVVFHKSEAEVVPVIAVTFGAEVTLGNCSNKWIFNYGEVLSNTFSLRQSQAGFYHCHKGSEKVFYLAVAKALDIELTTHPRKYNMVGDVIKVTCTGSYNPGKFYWATMNLALTDSSDREYRRYSEVNRDCQIDLGVEVKIHLTKPGPETYFCTFNSEVEAGISVASYNDSKKITIHVYMAPTNVQPDRVSQDSDGPINCTSYGDPTPDYKWTCDGDGWKTEGLQLQIQNNGNYFCTCVASSVIMETVYEASWNGTIMIGVGAETKHLNGLTFVIAVIWNDIL